MSYFPINLALGDAFCNRKKELKQLTYNIENVNPALIRVQHGYV